MVEFSVCHGAWQIFYTLDFKGTSLEGDVGKDLNEGNDISKIKRDVFL